MQRNRKALGRGPGCDTRDPGIEGTDGSVPLDTPAHNEQTAQRLHFEYRHLDDN